MKAVIDTNVLVSGLLSADGAPARVLDMVVMGHLTPVFDDRILSEYRDVLARPKFGFTREDRKAVMHMFKNIGQQISAPPLSLNLPDPDDLPFVEVALEAMCDFLVTGNKKHFPARLFGRLSSSLLVVTPADLVAQIGELNMADWQPRPK